MWFLFRDYNTPLAYVFLYLLSFVSSSLISSFSIAPFFLVNFMSHFLLSVSPSRFFLFAHSFSHILIDFDRFFCSTRTFSPSDSLSRRSFPYSFKNRDRCHPAPFLFLQADTDEEKTMDSSSESSSSGYDDSDVYSLTLQEQGPEMVVLGTLRKVGAWLLLL